MLEIYCFKNFSIQNTKFEALFLFYIHKNTSIFVEVIKSTLCSITDTMILHIDSTLEIKFIANVF